MMMMDTDNRRAERTPLAATVNFRKPKEMAYEVLLEDLSPQGCRIALRERVQPGQLLWITVPGLEPLQSWVRWNSEWQAGIEFERPMHVAVFDHFAARLGEARTAH